MPYDIAYHPSPESEDHSIAILRDGHGLRVATFHGEHCCTNAQLLATALVNPNPLEAIQRQTMELMKLRTEIAGLKAQLKLAESQTAELDSLAQYVLGDPDEPVADAEAAILDGTLQEVSRGN